MRTSTATCPSLSSSLSTTHLPSLLALLPLSRLKRHKLRVLMHGSSVYSLSGRVLKVLG